MIRFSVLFSLSGAVVLISIPIPGSAPSNKRLRSENDI